MNYLYFAISGVLGVCFNLLMKYKSMSTDSKNTGIRLPFKKYLQDDLAGIALSFLSVGAWLMCFGEFAEKYPLLQTFARASFFCMGAIGTYVIMYFLSNTKKNIRKVVSENSGTSTPSVTEPAGKDV